MLCWGKALYILNKTPTQFDAFHGLYHSFVCSTYIVVTICCRVWVFFSKFKTSKSKTVSQVWPMFARFCWMVCNWHWWHLRCLTGRAGRRLVGVDWWSAICWDVAPGGGSWTVRVPEMRLDSLQPEACVSGGGFKDLFFFSPNPVEMIQFVLFIIFFKWVESWNHQLAKDVLKTYTVPT